MATNRSRDPDSDPVGWEKFTSRPQEGVVEQSLDMAKFTEWRLLNRGYIPRGGEEGRNDAWLTGFYHFNRPGISPGGWDTSHLDEDGFNEVAFVPVGEQANKWAETTWKKHFPGLYAWYRDEKEWRPYWHNAILFIKNDVYIHTDKTYNQQEDF